MSSTHGSAPAAWQKSRYTRRAVFQAGAASRIQRESGKRDVNASQSWTCKYNPTTQNADDRGRAEEQYAIWISETGPSSRLYIAAQLSPARSGAENKRSITAGQRPVSRMLRRGERLALLAQPTASCRGVHLPLGDGPFHLVACSAMPSSSLTICALRVSVAAARFSRK